MFWNRLGVMLTATQVNVLTAIEEIVADGWQVSAVWLVPATSELSSLGRRWEAHITRPEFQFGDVVIELSAVNQEQVHAIAAAIHQAGDASATHLTSGGCLAIGPTAAWCRDPLRNAIVAVRS